VAETLPERYRAVLDRVADLEAAGHRREADLVRAEATRAYSRRWNHKTAARLDRLADRAARVLDGRDRPRRAGRSRRPTLAVWFALAPATARGRLAAWQARRRADRRKQPLEQPTA
ncbi:MAG TPA: hypothetical protein VET90_06740, partial [Candidatus Binatus sp.]|nr:hypothetical protein [Candidatus Binatus sp.]